MPGLVATCFKSDYKPTLLYDVSTRDETLQTSSYTCKLHITNKEGEEGLKRKI